jgi:hypothetical protein
LAATGDHSENLGERKTDDDYPKGYSDELLEGQHQSSQSRLASGVDRRLGSVGVDFGAIASE